MLLTTYGEVRLHRGTQSIAETVGVVIGKHVLVFSQRVEVGLVQQEPCCQCPISIACAALPGNV
jgi:hypothetical protein